MCGVFGFAAKGNKSIDLRTLKRIAIDTMARGEHAWGMAWIDGGGRLRSFKQTGRIVDSLPLLGMARDARLLIGHCRFATQGNPRDNINNHPHPADGGWIVHNGMIPRYDELVARYDLHPTSDCDSEVLGLLIERLEGSLADRCDEASHLAGGRPLVMLGLWKPGRLVAVRRGNPLHVGRTRAGTYLASLPYSLPGRVSQVADDHLLEFAA